MPGRVFEIFRKFQVGSQITTKSGTKAIQCRNDFGVGALKARPELYFVFLWNRYIHELT